MRQAGVFAGVKAVLLGQFTECGPGPDGTTVEQVLREHFSALDVPVLEGAPFGHVPDNRPLLFGATAHVDADAGTVDFSLDS
jgi:muramoyltetrapeptide carboxypeptidase